MIAEIAAAIQSATGLDAEMIAGTLQPTRDSSHGDFAFPCFLLAKQFKKAPPQCAAELAGKIELPVGVQKAEAVGPYLNFLDRSTVAKETVLEFLADDFKTVGSENSDKTVIVEYSSPNIAKPFHVGHLRTTLIGHSLDRIYRRLGYNVVSVNHLGDWGTQFGFVFAGCELWGKPEQASIDDLVELYKRASVLRKQQDEDNVPEEDKYKPNVNEMARAYFKRLEDDQPEAVQFWQWCLDISVSYLKKVYSRLGVHFDYYTGESFYRDKLAKVEDSIRNSGILEESRGALGVDLGKKLGFVRIFAEDGRSLYITRDIAAAIYRHDTFGPYKNLYIVGAPQKLHFQQLKEVLRRLNHPAADEVTHIPYGHVPGISTRSSDKSDKISLHLLLDEAHERAREAYQTLVKKQPEGVDVEVVAESVGLGAIFFNYLSRGNIKDFHFSWDDALSFQGDTGPYVQYALARINSIEAKAAESGIEQAPDFDGAHLVDADSYQIVFLLSKFQETLRKAEEYEPYHVAMYLLALAKTFSSQYKKLRVVGEEPEVAKARLALFCAVRNVLHVGLTLIGVPPVERM